MVVHTQSRVRTGPIHVLLFAASFPPRIGGYERQVQSVASYISGKAADVTVLTPEPAQRPQPYLEAGLTSPDDGARILRFPSHWILWDTVAVPSIRSVADILKRKPHEGTIVVTGTRFFPTSWLGWFYSFLHGVPLVHVEHGAAHPVAGNRRVAHFIHAVDHICGQVLSRGANRVVAVSKASRNFLSHIGIPESRSEVVPDGVPEREEKSLLADSGEFDEGVGCTIGYVGRLAPGKGLETLVFAFNRAAKLYPDVKLSIVGEGPLKPELEALATSLGTPCVEFLGPASPEHIGQVYDGLDVVVIPSLSEGFGLVMLEAAQHGCAIIASDIPAFREVMTPGEEFVSVIPADVKDLTDALGHLLENPEARKSLASKAFSKVKEWPTWDTVSEMLWTRICDTYKGAIS